MDENIWIQLCKAIMLSPVRVFKCHLIHPIWFWMKIIDYDPSITSTFSIPYSFNTACVFFLFILPQFLTHIFWIDSLSLHLLNAQMMLVNLSGYSSQLLYLLPPDPLKLMVSILQTGHLNTNIVIWIIEYCSLLGFVYYQIY